MLSGHSSRKVTDGAVILLVVFVVSAFPCGVAGSGLGDPKNFLDAYARIFDRSRMKSGWIKYEFQEDAGPANRVELLFHDQLFWNHTTSISSSSIVESTEWFDGSRFVHMTGGTNSRALIKPLTGGLQNASFLVLGRAFGYWDDQAKILSSLEPVGSEKQIAGTKYTFRDAKTKRVLVYETALVDGSTELPLNIRLTSAQGETIASWSYDQWHERGGGIWLPDRVRFEDYSDALEGKPPAHHVTVYEVVDAIFNMPVTEAWFIPRIPKGTVIEDHLCEPGRIILNNSFDPDHGFRDVSTGYDTGSSSGSSNQVSLAQLRRTATDQQTNVVAWLNYGRAALKDISARMKETGELPGTNAYDEALYALGKGLLLDPNNYRLHAEIATAYEQRARRKPSEDDQTKVVDLEKALDHCALALSNAASPGERARIAQRAAYIRERLDAEREMSRNLEAFEKASPAEKQKLVAEGAKRAFASDTDQRRLDDARKRAQREPDNTGALLDYAELLLRVEYQGLGNTNAFSETRAVLGKAVGLDEHNARTYELMGQCLDLQGR